MRVPAIHTADAIKDIEETKKCGRYWFLVRPEPYYYWKQRWRLAWMVFTGKADAVTWIDQ